LHRLKKEAIAARYSWAESSPCRLWIYRGPIRRQARCLCGTTVSRFSV